MGLNWGKRSDTVVSTAHSDTHDQKKIGRDTRVDIITRVRLETSLYQVLFNPREYTMVDLSERTERTEKDICICAE
jgi:hypothetical protein